MATTKYSVQIGDEIIEFTGPDNLSDRQIERLADTTLRKAKPGQTFPHSKYVGMAEPRDEAPQNDSSAVGSFFRNIPKDALLNWGDELAAAGNAYVPGLAKLDNLFGVSGGNQQYGDFAGNMADFRAQQEADESQHSTASALGDFAGIGATMLPATRALRLLPEAAQTFMAARPYLTALGAGATTGAVSGAGAGEGNRGQSAALGGLSGAALAFGLTGAMQFAPRVAQYAKMLFKNGATQNAIAQIQKALLRDGFDVSSPQGAQALRDELARYGTKPVSLADVGSNSRARAGVGLRTPNAAQQQSIDVIGSRQEGAPQRLASDIRANVAPRTDVHALDEALVQQRADEAGPLREKALFEEAPTEIVYRGGAPFNPDFEGPSFFTPDKTAAQTYADEHAARFGTPGELQQTTLSIKNPAPQDVVLKEAKKLGLETNLLPASIFDPVLQGKGGGTEVRQLMENLKRQGYDGTILDDLPFGPGQPMKTHIPFDLKQVGAAGGRRSRIVNDPELQGLARLPLAQRALGAALEQANAERDLLAITGQSIEHLPDLARGSQLDMRTFDYLKRYLDDEVNRLYKRGDTKTFSAAEANQVKNLRDAIREKLKAYNPEYADYLNAYKGSSEMIDALEQGRNFDALDPEQIAKEQGGRSTAAQELYRVGAARSLLDKIRTTKDGASAAKRILNSPESRSQLAATGVTPANAQRLNTAVDQERNLSLMNDELRGSQTDARRLAAQDAEGVNIPLSGGFSAGGGYGFLGLRPLAQYVLNKGLPARNAAINEQLLPRILETDPAAVNKIIDELERSGQTAKAAELRRALISRNSSAATGALIGGMVALPSTGGQ